MTSDYGRTAPSASCPKAAVRAGCEKSGVWSKAKDPLLARDGSAPRIDSAHASRTSFARGVVVEAGPASGYRRTARLSVPLDATSGGAPSGFIAVQRRRLCEPDRLTRAPEVKDARTVL